jgi:protein kinase C substrate 80K-H
VEQSGTLLGKFVNYKREGAELVMQYEGGARCWGGDARSATVRVSCGATNEIVSVTEPNRCQYLVAFRSPTACTPALLQQLEQQIEADNALLNSEEENVI